jgi:uncharacterized protein
MVVGGLFAVFFGFIAYQAYLTFFVYTHDQPTRYERGILEAAEDGDAEAQYTMGMFLATGRRGIEPDPAASRRWFESAAAQNHAGAQFRLGDIYQHGRGVAKDPHQALRHLRLADGNGSFAARNALGDMYRDGVGVDADNGAALALYRSAAEAGFAPAQRNMGFMAAKGSGMARDYDVAMAWYRKAATQSDAVATANIGIMYEYGQGVAADPLRAWQCYFMASLRGHHGADRHMTRVAATLPVEWRQQGLYEREGRDCMTGAWMKLTRPVSRVRE